MLRKLNEQKFCGWCGSIVDYLGKWNNTCRGCGYKNYINPKPCTSIFIVKGDNVAMVEQAMEPAKGKYNMPGGFVDISDESIEAGALRELKEELGIRENVVKNLEYFGSGVSVYPWNDSEICCLAAYYICELNNYLFKIDLSENSRIRWVGAGDLPDIDFAWDIDKVMLTKYFIAQRV